jgi:hypothetical protein
MAKSSRAYRSAKRSRELDRLRKQEEKRLRRQHKAGSPEEGGEATGEGPPAEGGDAAETSETGAAEEPGDETA